MVIYILHSHHRDINAVGGRYSREGDKTANQRRQGLQIQEWYCYLKSFTVYFLDQFILLQRLCSFPKYLKTCSNHSQIRITKNWILNCNINSKPFFFLFRRSGILMKDFIKAVEHLLISKAWWSVISKILLQLCYKQYYGIRVLLGICTIFNNRTQDVQVHS